MKMENINTENLVIELLKADDILKELECLENLLGYLKEPNDAVSLSPGTTDDLEKSFFRKAKLSDMETSVFPQELLINKDILNNLTFYLFQRRFGWSEQSTEEREDGSETNPNNSSQETSQNHQLKLSPARKRRSGSLPFAEESKVKTMLNAKLDELIQLYASEEEQSHQILESYIYALQEANTLPVVRSQLFCHIFEWFAVVISETAPINSQVFLLIKTIIVCGITDVWSAIRNTCVSRMSCFIECFSVHNLKDIFQKLVEICNYGDSQWQAKEGAIMAIGKILQSFKLAAVPKSVLGKSTSDASDTIICRRFGHHHFAELPSFIAEPLHKILYKLLSNSQLSIREQANRSFSSFLLRSEFSQVLKSFKVVVLHLAKEASQNKQQGVEKRRFADASKVDGFIKAAEFLIKQIPTKYILNNWHLCFATFSHYLMHPASTVRQAASSVFKYMVAKQTLMLQLPILVIKSLVFGWKTDIISLKSSSADLKGRQSLPSQRNSVKCLEKQPTDNIDISELWEWREGRLLAYELILKFFITNHIHYTFPAYTITRAVHATNSAADQGANQRPGIANFHKFSMSHNFGAQQDEQPKRFERLPRSLTMECDPLTQKFISSLAEKEKNTKQTSSLLEALRQREHLTTRFEDLKETLSADDVAFSPLSEKSIKDFEALSLDNQTSVNELSSNEEVNISFGAILIQIFIQTIESVADSRWELRRMAYQVLPLISETIRFYDARLLENIWESYLSANSSKLGFGACVSLKDSLSHAARLVRYFENPPDLWKDIDRCRLAAKRIVNSINEGLPQLLSQVAAIVRRPCFDKLSIIAIEVLMLSTIHFSQESVERHLILNVISKLEVLFIHAFRSNDYALYLSGKMDDDIIGRFETPKRGFLSCAAKGTSFCPTARQVQDHFYVEIQRLMPSFVRHSSLENVIYLLPIMLKEISSLIEASVEVQNLFQACHFVLKDAATALEMSKSDNGTESLQMIKKVFKFACSEICNIIAAKSLELHFLRQYLDVLLVMCQILGSNTDLKSIFIAVATMLDVEDSVLVTCEDEEPHESSEEEKLRIRLLSNDIRQSPIDQTRSIIGEEQEGTQRNLLESQALSRTLDLNGNFEEFEEPRSASPYQRVESPFQEDYDSDWDSWEDEEEDVCQFREVLRSFLVSLREIMSKRIGKVSIFMHELSLCSAKDQRLLEGIL